jgi:hypothetical protein
MEFNMQFRQIGVLWKIDPENENPYYSGELDLGVLGRINLAIFLEDKKKGGNYPDGTIHVKVKDEDK